MSNLRREAGINDQLLMFRQQIGLTFGRAIPSKDFKIIKTVVEEVFLSTVILRSMAPGNSYRICGYNRNGLPKVHSVVAKRTWQNSRSERDYSHTTSF